MIQVQQLVKRYGTTTALNGVSFTIPTGQVCGYLGPNGAGKSTTVRILTGVMQPTSGNAAVAGFDVAAQPLEVKKRIGYVPESAAAYQTLSINEYLALVGALHHMESEQVDEKARSLLELLQINQSADQRIATLSKGMRQKVVIIAALLHDPEILLFDEPLSGLDVNAAASVKELLREVANRGGTVIYCSHILDVVERLCERVILLNKGEIRADGSPAELMSQASQPSLESAFRWFTTIQQPDAP